MLFNWKRLLRVPWETRRSNQSNLKEINPENSLEGLMPKLNTLATWWKNWLPGKDPDAGKDWAQEQKQAAVNEMVGRHHDSHQTHGRELEQSPGDNEGQGSLVCCSPWSQRVRRDWATEQQWPTSMILLLLYKNALLKYNAWQKEVNVTNFNG